MATVKTQAHCLLAGAAAAAVCAWPWAQSSLAADFVHHTALAATIGGLADWWGVTALFKRPMGINAPGTDVLRNNYERLTTGLADFVSNDLLTAENVMQAVADENFAKLLLAHFAQQQNVERLWQTVRPLAEHALQSLNTSQAEQLLLQELPKYIASLRIPEILVDALQKAVANGSFNGLWQLLAQDAKQILHKAEFTALLEGLAQMAEEEYNKDSLLRNLFVSGQAAKLVPLFVQELEKTLDALADPASELRRQLDNWLLARMEDYRHDIAFADWLNGKLSQMATAKALAFKELLQTQDVDILLQLLQNRLQLLANSEVEQGKLDHALKELLLQVLTMQHDTVYDLVLQKLQSYDKNDLIAKMELRVGDDLQNIRKSGTCIGGLLGAVLFVIATLAERLVS
ncbi:DUF445 family protein [uncultured Phascolarctobacterium sp.]|uniref:DUF445 family protein n=1 Tax=uncultured Phascolarctobacterium sp. TaxID=512296 RepID=UPI0025E8AD6F|nr:DUF445 family protein [uncultured Phascolarctobacterium sp.]